MYSLNEIQIQIVPKYNVCVACKILGNQV